MKIKFPVFCSFIFIVSAINSQPISLAGKWKLAIDSSAVGEAAHWETMSFTRTINLPGSTDEVGVGNSLPLFKSALGIKPLPDYPDSADFGMLTRKHKYIGVAWYQKEVNIPSDFAGKQITLALERVLWRSKVWVDDQSMGSAIDYLSTPHQHLLGTLKPGKHLITIMVDNREVYAIGTLGHSYCPHMQTQWNGVVGKIEISAKPLLAFDEIQVFPSFSARKVDVRLQLQNTYKDFRQAKIAFTIRERKTGAVVAESDTVIKIESGIEVVRYGISIAKKLRGWDEFEPNMYELVCTLIADKKVSKSTTSFAFRDLGIRDKHFTINGKKIIYRNSHEGMFFARTGYPATDKKYWLNVFKIYKKYALNSVRFHSSCPPEAAFAAADELGIYLQVEFFWMDAWMGYKNLIGGKNDTLNKFVRNELHRALQVYGNHPSVMLVAIGNELGGDFEKMGEWIAEEKQMDPRHFYAAGIAHKITTADDFVEYGGKAEILSHKGSDWDYTNNYTIAKKHNYDPNFIRKDLPEFTHEAGQYVVHPLWSEIDGYKRGLAPLNLQYFKQKAVESGVDKLDSAFQLASGNLNRIFYKAEIEATLRTKQAAGYALLGMVDYPGQGEALMGWVDPTYKDKIFITPKQFKQYGHHTVPLIRMEKWVWQDGDSCKVDVEVANYGPNDLSKAMLRCTLKDGDKIVGEKMLPAMDLPRGELTTVGGWTTTLMAGHSGKQLILSVQIEGTNYMNTWDIWVFPKPIAESCENVIITTSVDTALLYLAQAKKVLLVADKLGAMRNRSYACFSPVFWSGTWFYDQESEVLGAVVRNTHAALKQFPSKGVLDWQWQDICNGAKGFVLNELPRNYQPIIQPVDDYHFGNKLGSLFELQTKNGGLLMVCGYNLNQMPDSNIAMAQLRRSVLEYMQTNKFRPTTIVDESWLIKTFTTNDKLPVKPAGFENAYLYVRAGQNHPLKDGDAQWEQSVDQSFTDSGFTYKVVCDNVYKDGKNSAWTGKAIHIDITVPFSKLMSLKIKLNDWDKRGRTGEINSEDAPTIPIGLQEASEWINIPITRENCLDGKLSVDIKSASKYGLMITDMVLNPMNN